jgi:hypothetical protein
MHTHRFLLHLRQGFLLLSFGLSILLNGCGKDKATEPEVVPASVETSSLNFISPIGVEVTGKVVNPGNAEIEDHGFIYWFNAEGEIAKGIKVSLGGKISSGFFTTTINNLDFPKGDRLPTLFVTKAYVTDKNGTRYGDIYSARFNGVLVTAFSPNIGKSGDIVSLSGLFKGLKSSDIKITMGGIPIIIKELSEIQLKFEIPTNLPVEHGQTVELKMQVAGVTSEISYDFKILANVKNINPKSGPLGTRILLIGDNLPTSQSRSMILYFGNQEVIPEYTNGLYVQLSPQTASEKVELFYHSEGKSYKFPLLFEITPFVIKSISPNPLLYNDLVTVQLDNFIYHELGGNVFYVNAGAFPLPVTATRDGKLIFALNQLGNLQPGNSYPLKISYGPHTVTTTESLKVVK